METAAVRVRDRSHFRELCRVVKRQGVNEVTFYKLRDHARAPVRLAAGRRRDLRLTTTSPRELFRFNAVPVRAYPSFWLAPLGVWAA